MPVVDHLISSLIKYLQKKQKQRKRSRIKSRRIASTSRKTKKSKSISVLLGFGKRKKASAKKRSVKRSSKKSSKKSSSRQKKTTVKPKKGRTVGKISRHPKTKRKKIKIAKKRVNKSLKKQKFPKEISVGEVTHYFSKIKVIVLKITGSKLSVGDKIHIIGGITNIFQQVKSLQIESVDVKAARKGQLVGLKVSKKAKEGDRVFKVG